MKITRKDLIIEDNGIQIRISLNEKVRKELEDDILFVETSDYLFIPKEEAIADFLDNWNSQY